MPTAKSRSAYCNKCRNLRDKERDLARWAFRKLKANCKRRRNAAPEWKKCHYDFLIDLEYFREFAEKTQILMGRGIYSESMGIDRIEEELGYRPGNLRPLKNWENLQKEHARRKRKIFDWELAYKRRNHAFESEEEEKFFEGTSEFRFE
jgi:hypothetical protein